MAAQTLLQVTRNLLGLLVWIRWQTLTLFRWRPQLALLPGSMDRTDHPEMI